MQLENRFTIPVPIDRAWEVLLDVERVIPCFPGAAVTSVSGDSIEGSVRMKLGPVLLHYTGTATFLEKDEKAHRAVLKAEGNDRKGGGSAGATITAELLDRDGQSTECVIVTDLEITGRPAQFGRGIMLEVGNRITAQFARNLSEMLTKPEEAASDGAASATTEASAVNGGGQEERPSGYRPRAQSEDDDNALDVLKFAQGAALKRLLPILGAAFALLVWSALRRRAPRTQPCCVPCTMLPRT